MDPLTIVAKATLPLINKGSNVPEPVLTVCGLHDHLGKLRSFGTWKKGNAGHYSLPLYLDDGKTGSSRPCLIKFDGHSKYGLGFYESEDGKEEKPEVEDDKKKKKKKRNKPASIAFQYDSSPEVRQVDKLLNAALGAIMIEELKSLKKILAPGNPDVKAFARKVARNSSGSSQRVLRVTCYPGVTQLDGPDGKAVCMKDFPKETGAYQTVAEVASIDASINDGIISYGLVLYGKRLGKTEAIELLPLEYPEKEAPEAISKLEDIDETQLMADLKKKRKEEQKAKKEKKRKEINDEFDSIVTKIYEPKRVKKEED